MLKTLMTVSDLHIDKSTAQNHGTAENPREIDNIFKNNKRPPFFLSKKQILRSPFQISYLAQR